jgi:hypothetical protein
MPQTFPAQPLVAEGTAAGAARFDPATRRRLSGPGLRTFFNIAAAWRLSNAEQQILLGSPAASTFYNWKRGRHGTLSFDELERISLVLGIYKALHTLFPDDAVADGWLRQPNTNPLFSGRSALDRMLDGSIDDLYAVRRFLDAWRSGWH